MENDIVRMLFLRRQRQKKRWKIKTISGAPPLSFKAKAGALKDYRIYGNTVDGESVGDVVTKGEHTGEYVVPVTVSNGTDTQTIPIYLTEQIKKVGDEAEYIDYGKQKQHRVRKNLINSPLRSYVTSTGITVTLNADRSVTLNGTADNTVDNYIYLYRNGTVPESLLNKPVIISGGHSVALIRWWHYNGTNIIVSTGSDSAVFTASQGAIEIFVAKGTVLDNVTVYPMIRFATIEDDTYEPYIENTDLNVTLPALPTLAGTNVLTVGTEVQPSGVEIMGRIKKGE